MLIKNQEQIINNGKNTELKEVRKEVLEILTSAVKAVDPYNVVKTKIDGKSIRIDAKKFNLSDYKNIYLIGFGKASIGMAQAVCEKITVKKGIILTNELKKTIENRCISILVGSHPIPSQKNIDATNKLLDIAEKCNEDDLLIVLISGGGSALLCKPRVSIYDLQKVTDLLLKSGADIKEINTIRKHLSFVKGGQLTKLAKCTIISLIISDIVGDPIEFIASGPTFPDSTTFIDAQNILKKYKLLDKIPSSVRDKITDGIHKKIPETPKDDDIAFDNVFNFIVANNEIACNAAEEKAEELGYKTMVITTNLVGDAKERGRFLVDKALNFQTYAKKMIFISGGETTVTIKGKGIGGRNQEMVLSCVKEIANKNFIFSSFATDGIDGNSNGAGAIADSFTLERAKKNKLNPNIFLNENNSYNFFKILGDSFITGPTGTNVMDIQVLIKLK
ncbi:MAG: glycerate kinase [Thermoplasmatales archaeon]|nr:MAG: glycerate kinase [Thermoplasmatales archaeon]